MILHCSRYSQAAERRSTSAPDLTAMCETPDSVTSSSVTVAPFQGGLTDIETGHSSSTVDTDNSSESDSAIAALLAGSSSSSSSNQA